MTSQELTDKIFEQTGLKLGDYGFITESNHPILPDSIQGYSIWKKQRSNDGTITHGIIIPKDFEDSYNKIIDFLKN